MSTETMLSFADLGLPAALCQTLTRLGYEQPSEIQKRSIQPLLEGRDLLGIAQTGTGKTAAFALPLLSRLGASELEGRQKRPSILVLTPTRELCIQVAEAFESYAENLNRLSIVPIYGGQDMGTQLRQLKKGAQVIVGTPGRVMDHLRRKTLDLSNLQSMVLDEADEMLRMGFIDDVQWILDHTPEERQLALFSATMPAAIKKISTNYLNDAVEVKIKPTTQTVNKIEQSYIEVNNARKLNALDLILETEEFDGVMVFVRTKILAQELAQKLEARHYRAAAIHGDLNQRQRELCIRQLKESVIDIMVATDVAARGIDVPRISLVVNYDIPYDSESYVHRIGRTGRAGRSGKAVLFVTQRERRMIKSIEKTTGQDVARMQLPTAKQLTESRLNRFAEGIKKTLEKESLGDLKACLDSVKESHGLDDESIALALAFSSQKHRSLVVSERDTVMQPSKSDRERKSRNKRGEERPARKSRSEKNSERENIPMDTYKLAVGHSHSVRVSDILGAVANELGMDSANIGEIRLEENHSSIELPADMPNDVFQHFKKVRIRNYPSKPELQGSGKSKKGAKAGGKGRAENTADKGRRKKRTNDSAEGAKNKRSSGSRKPVGKKPAGKKPSARKKIKLRD